MKNPVATRLLSLAALTTIALLQSGGANAAPKAGAPIFKDRGAAAAGQLPAHAKAQTAVAGTLNASALNAASIDVTLADGQVVTARQQRVVRDDAKGVQSWLGTFDDAPGSLLVLSKARGVLTGFANYKDQVIEIVPSAEGKHVQYTVDARRVPKGDDGMFKSSSGDGDVLTTSTSTYGTGGTTLATGTAAVQDLLVVYTAASASTWGQATIESMIQSAVESANQAYVNSGVNVTLRMVGLQQTTLAESGSGMQTTLGNLRTNSSIRSLRDSLGADMVMLVSQDSDWCGYADLRFTTLNGVTTTDAYAVSYSSCLSNQTLAHEVGHLQQLEHNRENANGTLAAYPYSYGYRQCVSGGFSDIMSYSCSGAARILQFSTPNRTYNGFATGIAYESDPSRAADAARSLNDTALKVANYKSSSSGNVASTAPVAPSGLAARSTAYNAVSLGWTDNSTNESGFKVERSADGVNFTEIASLGSGTVSYTDAAVSAKTSYYYRVRAFNSVGGSPYSSTLAVTTPDVPPPPPALPAAPSSVAATNNANGTALVSWGDASTNETGFEVRRETFNSKRGTWGSAILAATVTSNVTSFIDQTGNGTFRYTVRAVNAGGGSGYVGPASVSVSGGTTTGKGRNR